MNKRKFLFIFNPCFSGLWVRTNHKLKCISKYLSRFNPCFSGLWVRTYLFQKKEQRMCVKFQSLFQWIMGSNVGQFKQRIEKDLQEFQSLFQWIMGSNGYLYHGSACYGAFQSLFQWIMGSNLKKQLLQLIIQTSFNPCFSGLWVRTNLPCSGALPNTRFQSLFQWIMGSNKFLFQ